MKTEAPSTILAGMMALRHRPSPQQRARFALPTEPQPQQQAEPALKDGDALLSDLIRLL